MIVFDLDGCLIDSGDLIRESYRDVGLEPPAGFMARMPGSIGDHGLRARKDAAYLKRLASDPLKLLPPWEAAETLSEEGEVVGLLTSAPQGTLKVLDERVISWPRPGGGPRPWPFLAASEGLNPAGKEAWLTGAGYGIYVDDQTHVRMPHGWRFVHYTGQDVDELLEEIR